MFQCDMQIKVNYSAKIPEKGYTQHSGSGAAAAAAAFIVT